MLKKIFSFSLIIILSLGLTSTALAQRQTGSIKGRIISKQGVPLSGAFIYVSSPASLGIRTYLTSRTGKFKIPFLPPGRYKVIAEVPGFKTVNVEDIMVRVGMTVTLEITTEEATVEEEITAKIPSPTVDVEAAKTASVVEKELLQHVPFSRNLFDVIHSAPGFVSEKSFWEDQSSVHGSSVRSNAYAFDGITINDLAGRQLLTSINFDSIGEVELETSAHPADVGVIDGGYINIVSKSRGNRTEGGLSLYYSDDTMASSLRTKEEVNAPNVSPPTKDRYLYDFSLSLGEQLVEDMLWFFGNFHLTSSSQTTPFIPWTDPSGTQHLKFSSNESQKMSFLKLSSQFVPQLKFVATASYSDRYQSAWKPTLSWNAPEEASQILQHQNDFIASSAINYIIDQNTFADLKAGYFQQRIPLRLNQDGLKNAQYIDEETGHLWGSSGFNENRLGKRFQATASLTHFVDSMLGGDHELMVGAEYEDANLEVATWKEDNLLVHYYNGDPYYFGMDQSPSSANVVGKGKISFYLASQRRSPINPKAELKRLSFFAQDSLTLGRTLTLLLGLRFDRSTTRLLNLYKDTSGNPVSLEIGQTLIAPLCQLNPYVQNATLDWSDVMSWNALSPRIGLSFNLFGKGKTIFKASYSRYSDSIMLDYLLNLNPISAHRFQQFEWFDENMDGKVDSDDTFVLYPEDYQIYSEESYRQGVDAHLKSPSIDELTLGLNQEVRKDLSLRFNYIYKTKANIVEDVIYDLAGNKDWYTTSKDTEKWWVPFQTTVPQTDDFPETPVTVYFRSNDAPPLFYQLKNVPELKRKYQALEIALTKQMSNNWQLNGSLVLSRASGNVGLGSEASSGFSEAANSPNYFVNLPQNSRLDFDRPLLIRLMGTYKLPSDLFLSFFYSYASGRPWARSITIIPPESWAQEKNAWRSEAKVYLETPGTRRTAPESSLDLRIEKSFRRGNSLRWTLYIDILNALGYKSSFNFPNDEGFWFPDAENTTEGNRQPSSNYKNITLLSGSRVFRLSLNYRF